jgi:dethiobiotin synthetase
VANRVVPQQLAYADNLATLKAAIAAPLLLELPYEGEPVNG